LTAASLPRALDSLPEIAATIGERKPAFFLDFDGTISPLSPHPEMAEMPEEAGEVLAALAQGHVVCIVSGRDLAVLRRKVNLPSLYYAADHGYRIAGPTESGIELEVGDPEDRQELETASYELERRLRGVAGVVVETKGTSLSVHYRLVAESERPLVHRTVQEVVQTTPALQLTGGKLVHELRPRLPWDKGRAVLWLLGQLRLHRENSCPICIGDDLTDEDMFIAVRRWGVSVVVGERSGPTKAKYRVEDPSEVVRLLNTFVPGE
jgi:trehalose 6-phosphate phosphatase